MTYELRVSLTGEVAFTTKHESTEDLVNGLRILSQLINREGSLQGAIDAIVRQVEHQDDWEREMLDAK